MYLGAAQYDRPPRYPVTVICGGIDGASSTDDILIKIFAGVVAYTGNRSCYVNPPRNETETDVGWSWQAYEICIRRDLVKEQVFILGRMGNEKLALAIIINKLRDIEEAVEFVNMQHDDELWEELIQQCLHKPEMVGVLLEHTFGNLDPLYIVNMVPNGLEISRLRDRLVKIVTNYRTETSLRHGCNGILKADIVNLLVKYYNEARHGIYLSHEEDEARAKRTDGRTTQVIEKSPGVRSMEVKSKPKGGARCCMCFDPFSILSVNVIVFFCCYAYHMTRLMDSTYTSGMKGSRTTSQERVTDYGYDDKHAQNDSDVDGDRDGDDDSPITGGSK